MEARPPREKSIPEMLSRVLVELVDNNAHLLTVLDVQARLLARLEARDHEAVVDEINALLKARRREALRAVDAWALGGSTLFADDDGDAA